MREVYFFSEEMFAEERAEIKGVILGNKEERI
jgi:hypothetical protein